MARRSSQRLRAPGAVMADARRSRIRHDADGWSARSKVAVVLELLRGADIASVRERYDVALGDLLSWRDRFLAGGEAYLTESPGSTSIDPAGSLKRLVAALEADDSGAAAQSIGLGDWETQRVKRNQRR